MVSTATAWHRPACSRRWPNWSVPTARTRWRNSSRGCPPACATANFRSRWRYSDQRRPSTPGLIGRPGRMQQNKKRPSTPLLLQEKRQIERAPETESVPAHIRGIRQGRVGEALEQHWQKDGANGSPRQVRAGAMVRAVAKGLVRIGFAQRVVVLAIVEDVLVPV